MAESHLIDSSIELGTYTGVGIEIRTAGLFVRGIARLIDDLLRLLLLITIGFFVVVLGGIGVGLSLIAGFLVLWGYNIFFEILYAGVTPGKHFLGLRAVNADGTPIGVSNSLIRSLFLLIDLLPFNYLLGATMIALTKSHQRLGDIVAGTVVIYDEASKPRVFRSSGKSIGFPKPLTMEEKLLFLSFQERLDDLSSERAAELATTLEPILKKRDSSAVEEVIGIARQIRQGS